MFTFPRPYTQCACTWYTRECTCSVQKSTVGSTSTEINRPSFLALLVRLRANNSCRSSLPLSCDVIALVGGPTNRSCVARRGEPANTWVHARIRVSPQRPRYVVFGHASDAHRGPRAHSHNIPGPARIAAIIEFLRPSRGLLVAAAILTVWGEPHLNRCSAFCQTHAGNAFMFDMSASQVSSTWFLRQ